MAQYQDIDIQMADLDIDSEENGSFEFTEEVVEATNKFDLCLVGRFLTEKNLNVRAMKARLADIWKPTMGINIKEIEEGIFLFQFYHEKDRQWVLDGGPWSFDNAMLIIQAIPPGEQPLKVPLWYINFWIQIYELPAGFMSETVGKQLGNFFGEFMEYDPKNSNSIWREYMRIRIRLDVRRPLKRKKKVTRRDGSEFVVLCKYERLGEFCFVCGMITHTERFCRKNLGNRGESVVRDWGSWLRAPPRRVGMQGKSKWLREEDDLEWEARVGKDNCQEKIKEFDLQDKGKLVMVGRNSRDMMSDLGGKQISKVFSNSHDGPSQDKAGGIGLDQEELDGLNIEARKRSRNEIGYTVLKETSVGLENMVNSDTNMEATLSISDCVVSSSLVLAKPVMQASQFK